MDHKEVQVTLPTPLTIAEEGELPAKQTLHQVRLKRTSWLWNTAGVSKRMGFAQFKPQIELIIYYYSTKIPWQFWFFSLLFLLN